MEQRKIIKIIAIILIMFSCAPIFVMFYFPLNWNMLSLDSDFLSQMADFFRIEEDLESYLFIFRALSIPAAALQGIFLGIWLMILDKLKTNAARLTLLFLSLLMSIPLSLGVTELAFYVWSLT